MFYIADILTLVLLPVTCQDMEGVGYRVETSKDGGGKPTLWKH